VSTRADQVRRRALLELYRRKRSQESLHSFAANIEVPMSPHPALKPDETLVDAKLVHPRHISKLLEVLQRTVTRPFGRAIIQMPPGTAKSTYAGPVTLGWCIGGDQTGEYIRQPGQKARPRKGRYMIVSYGDDLASLQSRRTQTVIEQPEYSQLWDTPITMGSRTAESDWDTNTGCEVRAFGIMSGITGNRCNGVLIDDPVKNREQGDSADRQKKIVDEYQGSILSRLLPGAWVILIMTRWNESDLAGYILPDDYKGQSGMVKCKDGLQWEVLNLPAKAELPDDPLGRAPGEYIFPEFYPKEHWQMFENTQGAAAQRDWSSLYQQRPTNEGAGKFTRQMFEPNFYDADDLPTALTLVGAGDYAVTDGGGDWTELAIWGFDSNSVLWALEWWYDQVNTGISTEAMLEMIERKKVRKWFNEGGVIDKAMRPSFNRRQRELMSPGKHFCQNADGEMVVCHRKHDVWCDLQSLPSIKDKVAKAMNFQARASIGQVRFPRNAPWTERVIQQLIALPAGRHDDAVDVCGLIGRGIDQYHPARPPKNEERAIIQPFTEAWFMSTEFPDKPTLRYR
jgi:predicted phage terminase large subunit-like protein